MPLDHFHLHDGVEDRPDAEGTQPSGLVLARAEAPVPAGRTTLGAGARAHRGEDGRVAVTDDAGLAAFPTDCAASEAAGRGREDAPTLHDLARIDQIIASTEQKVHAQMIRLETPHIGGWAQDEAFRRLRHLRRDLAIFRKSRNIVADDEWKND